MPPDLAARLRAEIDAAGPMPLDRFWREAMTAPDGGYYATGAPIGAGGDFTTAPEISQIFGELIGLWLADTWANMGAADAFDLIELGPGRGQLLADTLRATRAVPGFLEAMRLVLVEASAPMRSMQAERLAAYAPAWSESWAEALRPEGPPLFIVANEFLDALPIKQFERRGEGWAERRVAWSDGALRFQAVDAEAPDAAADFSDAPEGAVLETSPERDALVAAVAKAVSARGGAALFIDYGHGASKLGDSLQALQDGKPADPLLAPGAADITSHVDFARARTVAEAAGARSFGPVEQGVFLLRLGAEARAAALSAKASPAQAATVARGLKRLIHPLEMGSLFKAMAILPKDASPPAGLAE